MQLGEQYVANLPFFSWRDYVNLLHIWMTNPKNYFYTGVWNKIEKLDQVQLELNFKVPSKGNDSIGSFKRIFKSLLIKYVCMHLVFQRCQISLKRSL